MRDQAQPRLADVGARHLGEDMKKTATKARGRRAAKIRVTSINKPPLDAAAARQMLQALILESDVIAHPKASDEVSAFAGIQ